MPYDARILNDPRFQDLPKNRQDEIRANIEPAESPGFLENLKNEVSSGFRQITSPETEDYPGSEALKSIPLIGASLRNLVGAALGGSRVLYSVPAALAKTYVADPLRARGYETAANVAEAALPLALSFAGGGVPGIGALASKVPAVARVVEAAPLLEKGLAGTGGFPLRVAGRLLDPLAAKGPTTLEKLQTGLANREAQLGEAAKTAEQIRPNLSAAEQAAQDLDLQMANLRAATVESKASQLGRAEYVLPAKPEQPVIAAIPGATAPVEAGQTFQEAVLPEARQKLYGESSARYEALKKQGESIPFPRDAQQEILATMDKLANETRLPRTAGDVAEQLQLEGANATQPVRLGETPGRRELQAAAQSFRDLDPKMIESLAAQGMDANTIMQRVRDGLMANPATMADAVRADQILSAASRGYSRIGNIAARSAVEELRQPIREALQASPLAEDLAMAKRLHAATSELVGPRSLSQAVFDAAPEQVVNKIFLPEGQPNLSMISDAKEIYQNVAPGEWPKLTGEALGKLQERSIGSTGEIDPGKFLNQWRRYRGTFEAALEPQAFDAVDSIARSVQKFNQSRKIYGQALREATQQRQLINEFYTRQRAQLDVARGRLGPQVKAANEGVADLTRQVQQADEQVARLKSFGLSGRQELMRSVASPYTMIALAQLGQALQATFTGNYSGAGRQLMQGAVWATLGNPMWITRLAQNPSLSLALSRAIAVQRGARMTLQDARYINAATRFLGDTIQQESQKGGQNG